MTASCNPSEHQNPACQRDFSGNVCTIAPADVVSYLGNNMGPNNILLFANILTEDGFIWLCLVYLKNSGGYPEQYTGKKTDMRQTKTTTRWGNDC